MYNFVIFGGEFDFVDIAYKDIANKSNVKYKPAYWDEENNRLLEFAYRTITLFSKRLGKGVPFKKFWNRYYYKDKFDNHNKLCFIYHGTNKMALVYGGFLDYAKRKYPSSKHVIIFWDVQAFRKINLNDIRNKMDLIIVFDKKEAETNNITYYPLFYSGIMEKKDINQNEKYDVFFCGGAKQRENELFDIYKKLHDNGIKCMFLVFGVNESEQRHLDGYIATSARNNLAHTEYLNYVMNSRCLLELKNPDIDGYTLRIYEALVYDKKVLTNNPNLSMEEYYEEKYMFYFSSVDDIDINFIKNRDNVNYKRKDLVSPERILDFIQKKLG